MQTTTMADDLSVTLPHREDPAACGKARENAPPSAKVSQGGGLACMLWFTGWLFTIGFAQLVWWKAIVGLLLWPYFLALALR